MDCEGEQVGRRGQPVAAQPVAVRGDRGEQVAAQSRVSVDPATRTPLSGSSSAPAGFGAPLADPDDAADAPRACSDGRVVARWCTTSAEAQPAAVTGRPLIRGGPTHATATDEGDQMSDIDLSAGRRSASAASHWLARLLCRGGRHRRSGTEPERGRHHACTWAARCCPRCRPPEYRPRRARYRRDTRSPDTPTGTRCSGGTAG